MNRHKQLSINLIASVTAFIINMGISFFLTPYITKNIGIEAYGFVSLGANFINYASLVTIALNSMAGRFITIEIHKDNWKAANKYFNSVLLANTIAAGVMLIPSILCVVFINKIVNVPIELLSDVRLLFAFLFANYLISIIASSFGVSTFATNKLYLKSLRETEARIIKALALLILFIFFEPAVSYLGFASFLVLVYIVFFNIYYTIKFLPNIKIKKEYFDYKAVLELISSGIWNTLIQVGQILLQGVDLLIANLYIGATAMGTLALAKTIPIVIFSLIATISAVFLPEFTILYAQNKTSELLLSIKRSMKLLGIIASIPTAILIGLGEDFFRLWVPMQNAKELQILSIITIAIIFASGSINSLYGIFTVTNKLKDNAIVLLVTGLLNVVFVFILLKMTDLGLFAISGVSTILGIVRNLAFTAPFGAKYLNLKWNVFFPEITKGVIAIGIATIIAIFLNSLIPINGWVTFFALSAIITILSLGINSFMILSKTERNQIKVLLLEKINTGFKR